MTDMMVGMLLAQHVSGEWHILKDDKVVERFPTHEAALDFISEHMNIKKVITLQDDTEGTDRAMIDKYLAEKQNRKVN